MELNRFAVDTLNDTPSWLVHLMALLLSIGYGYYHTFYGVIVIGVFSYGSALACALAIFQIIRHDPKPLYYYAVYFCQFFALIITSYYFGIRGLVLTAPFVSGAFFLFPYKRALIISCIFVPVALIVSFHVIETAMYIRISLATLFTLFFTIIFSHVIYKQQARSEYEAHFDMLTDILNRRGFLKRLNEQMNMAKKKGSNLVLFYFDIDKFKSVNDTYGHAVGDEVLVAFANRILGVLRAKEIFVENQKVTNFGRLYGDEFVLSISNIDSTEAADNIAERILSTINNPFHAAGHIIQSTVSIGICFAKDVDYKVTELLKNADKALYISKKKNIDRDAGAEIQVKH